MQDTDSEQSEIRRRFNRRYFFGINALFSGSAALILLLLGLTHPMNMAFINGRSVFVGFPNPYIWFGCTSLIALIAVHGIWILWREGKLTGRRFSVAAHTVIALASLLILFFLMNSWWMTEPHHDPRIPHYTPLENSPPPTFVWLLLPGTVLTLLPHAIIWLHGELLTRALRNAEEKPKHKRKFSDLALGDDGELLFEYEARSSQNTMDHR